MDLIRTLLVYMMLITGAATEGAPAVTVIPPTPTPRPTAAATAVSRAATPTAAPARYNTLYVGDKGENVRRMQQRLKELGYLKGKVDGQYGQQTRKAVADFQHNNGLESDGIAGRTTLALLYDGKKLVTARPDGATNAPKVSGEVNVTVPVYYKDEAGNVLRQVDMVCYGTTTINADPAMVGEGFVLASAKSVKITVKNGKASPASVTFTYKAPPTPSPIPVDAVVPIIYIAEDGSILHRTSISLAANSVTPVVAAADLVPSYYKLTSPESVEVTVNGQGIATPNTVVFTFADTSTPVPTRKPTKTPTARPTRTPRPTEAPTAEPTAAPTEAPTAAPTAEPTAAPTAAPAAGSEANITIIYIASDGTVLHRDTLTLQAGQEFTVAVDLSLVPAQYRLISDHQAVLVRVTADGRPEPKTVLFSFAAPSQSAEPQLSPAGDSARLNGVTLPLNWLTDEKETVWMSLKELADAIALPYTPNAECQINGHYLAALYTADGISALTVDEQNQLENGLLMDGDLMVNLRFLEALGAEVRLDGSDLSIDLTGG